MMRLSWEDARFRRTALLALALIILFLIVHELFGEHGYLALRRRRQELESLQLEVKRLQEENQKLEREIKALKSDPNAIEKLAREQLKLARPGEVIYALPDKETKNPPPGSTGGPPPTK